MDEFLWALDLAAECLDLLRDGMDTEMQLRRGTLEDVAANLETAVEAFQEINF